MLKTISFTIDYVDTEIAFMIKNLRIPWRKNLLACPLLSGIFNYNRGGCGLNIKLIIITLKVPLN